MSATPATVPAALAAPRRPFYVRNATEHYDLPGRYETQAEAMMWRAEFAQSNRKGDLFIVKERTSA